MFQERVSGIEMDLPLSAQSTHQMRPPLFSQLPPLVHKTVLQIAQAKIGSAGLQRCYEAYVEDFDDLFESDFESPGHSIFEDNRVV